MTKSRIRVQTDDCTRRDRCGKVDMEVRVRVNRTIGWLIAFCAVTVLAWLAWDLLRNRATDTRQRPTLEISNAIVRQWAKSLLHIAAPEPTIQHAADVSPTGETDLCDYGRIPWDSKFELPAGVVADSRAALHEATAHLLAGASDEDRALGLQLRITATVIAVSDELRRNRPECDANPDCARDYRATMSAPVTAAVEALAQHAVTTQNPAAYARAFLACHARSRSSDASTCPAITAAQWAQLEPRNAAPWLYIAEAARAGNDDAAVEDAFVRLAASQVSDLRWGSEFAVMNLDVVQALPRHVQLTMMVDIMGVSAAFPMPNLFPLMSFCAPERFSAANNRRQVCSDIGELLVQKDTSLIGMGAGIRIGERAGWPAARVANLLEERSAASAVSSGQLPDGPIFSCTSFERSKSWLSDVARFGEMGAARHRMQASGRANAEIVQEWSERMKRRAERIQAFEATEKARAAPASMPAR